jgi:hypothetical protein
MDKGCPTSGTKSGSLDVTILVVVRLLKPLGNPPPHSVKYFAASELLEQVKDRAWLAKVTNVLNQHWQKRMPAK